MEREKLEKAQDRVEVEALMSQVEKSLREEEEAQKLVKERNRLLMQQQMSQHRLRQQLSLDDAYMSPAERKMNRELFLGSPRGLGNSTLTNTGRTILG